MPDTPEAEEAAAVAKVINFVVIGFAHTAPFILILVDLNLGSI